MAAWQFVMDLVPISAANVAGVTAARMSRDQLDEIRLNFSTSQTELLLSRLESLLPEKKSWSASLRIWGDEKTDDIQVGLDGEIIEDVRFRLNVANLCLSLVGGICSLAHDLDCRLVAVDGGIIKPSHEAVVRAVMQSRAMQFVQDPEGFLKEALRLDREGR